MDIETALTKLEDYSFQHYLALIAYDAATTSTEKDVYYSSMEKCKINYLIIREKFSEKHSLEIRTLEAMLRYRKLLADSAEIIQ